MSDKPQKGSEEGIVRGREGRKKGRGKKKREKTTPLSQRPPACSVFICP